MTRLQRLRYSMVRPDGPDKAPVQSQAVEEIEAEIATISDKERAIGLVVAPIAAVVGLFISGASINEAKTLHQSYSIFVGLTYLMLAMSVLILVMAWLRKRLFLGIVTAMYGLAVFNLHQWGFGFPFIMVGAWYLVRAYRLQQSLRSATGDGPGASRRGGSAPPRGSRPRRNKRYTPPS
jgi:hypothetical protein